MHISIRPPRCLSNFLFIFAFFAVPVALQNAALGELLITEFMADNQTTLFDEDGDDPDWIELHNSAATPVELAGYHLTDDADRLDKWQFPSVTLGAGEFLVVFASGKNRTTPGSPLHTNFSLSSSGEYLALVAPDGVTIVQEFAPEFSRHEPDESYGVSFSSSTLVESGDTASILVPSNGSLGTSWTEAGFSPSGWQTGTVGVGFGLSVPGFTVEDAKSSGQISNLATADSVLNGNSSSRTVEISPIINYLDTGGDGRFPNNLLFPNGGGDDFAVRATGTIEIPVSGTWTFGTNSDDGVRVRVNGTNVINDDALHGAQDRFGQRSLTAGAHTIEMVFFERGGGAEVELFAAQGSFTSWNSNFRLIGDTASGGLAVSTSPEGGAGGGSIQTDIADIMKGVRGSAFVRIPFSVSNVSSLGALSLGMRYNDGFIAYLNGVEVARRNAPSTSAWNSVATAARTLDQTASSEGMNATAAKGAVINGTNVLAIHGLNVSAADGTFLVDPTLATGVAQSGSFGYFESPTPGAVNSAVSNLGRVLDPSVSPDRGIYTSSQTVTLTNFTDGAQIRYTTDGSAPTSTTGIIYTEPLLVDSTTVLRLGAFKSGFEPSIIKTHTYLFPDDVVDQSTSTPPGWPNTTVNGQTFNYGMDPEVTESNRQEIIDGLTAIPSFSIAIKQSDFTSSDTGIYTHAGSRGFAWERAASVELLNDPEGGFQQDAGLRIRGGFSRSGNNPKHALRLFFRKDYGDGKLNYPLFGDEGTDAYDNIDLRTSQNYSWSFQGNGNNTFMREVFARDTQRDMGQAHTRSRYAHVYINGQYWGIYMTQERSEASYGESYFGGERFDYDTIKSAGSSGGYNTEATDGSMAEGSAWHQLWEATREIGTTNASNANYFALQGLASDGVTPTGQPALLDSKNLIDYMMCVFYTGGYDAPLSTFLNNASNNWYTVRNSKGMEGFKFFMHDNEHSLGTGGNSNNRVGSGASIAPWKSVYSSITDYNRSNPQYMHEDLASNEEYRIAFADRAHELLFNDGLLTKERAFARLEERRAIVDQVIVAESARWGDSKQSNPLGRSDWESAVSDIRQFIEKGTDGGGSGSGRAAVLISQLRGFDGGDKPLYPPIDAPGFSQHGGYVASGTELTMTGGDILYTNDGVDPRRIGGSTYGNSTSYQGSTNSETLITSGSSWKYLDNGSNQGTAWRASGFNDAGWQSGNAQLGYGDGDEATEVSFGGNSSDKHATTYYRKTFQVTNRAQITSLNLELLRDDGAVVYLNGSEVLRSNMPAGTITSSTFAAGVVGGGDESTYFASDLNPAALVDGTNTIAVEVHQVSPTSSDTSFDLRLNATKTTSSTPIVLTGTGEMRIMARAKSGATWSALNQALFFVNMDPPSAANLVVSEIHYHPSAPSAAEVTAGFTNRDWFEWIELMNVGSKTINLRDARFEAGVDFDFNTADITSLAPGARVILVKNRAAFEFRYGTGLPVAGEFTGNLSNGGELIRIADPQGVTIREFAYNDAAPWPESADGLGFSLVLDDPSSVPAHGNATNWTASSAVGGSPGGIGSDPVLPILVNEVLTHTDFPQVDAIELYNPNTVPVDIGGWYLSDDFDTPKKYAIPNGTVLAPGEYIGFLEDNDGDPTNNATLPLTYFGGAFSLSSLGDDAYVFSADSSGDLTGFSHGVSFGAAENGVSFGRWVNSEGEESFPPMASVTLGDENSSFQLPDLLINEIHYNPATGGVDFVEVWNRSGAQLPLFDPENPSNTWQINGIDFSFPTGQTLAADELAVVVAGDPETFRTANGLSAGVKIYGPFGGSLSGAGERLSIRRPDGPTTVDNVPVVPMIDVDSVRYDDESPWPTSPDGQGPSLERINFNAYSDDAMNWTASAENGGTPSVLRGLLSLSLQTDGQGTITARPNQSNFLEGSQVQLTPVAAAGWEFAGWSGDASGSSVPLQVTMNVNKVITAVFNQRFSVAVESVGQGIVGLSPSQETYASGQTVALTATPAGGYRFGGWSGSVSGSSNPINLVVNSNEAVTATFIRQFDLNLSAQPGGTATASPNMSVFDSGESVTLTATPTAGFAFAGWSGGVSGTTNPLQLTMDSDKAIVANFAAVATLTTAVSGAGTVQQSPAGSEFEIGTAITLTASPNAGWVFTGWNGGLTGSQNPAELVLNASANVTANFAEVFSVTTSVAAGNGTVSLSPSGSTFVSGSRVVAMASPAVGYRFGGWSGSLSGATNPATLLVNSNQSVSATFIKEVTLDLSAGTGGTVSASPEKQVYDQGSIVTLTATAEPGYQFAGWSGDTSGSANPLQLTMTDDKAVSAVFTRVYSVESVVVSGQGTIGISPPLERYPAGTMVSIVATPSAGWRFDRWTGDVSGTVPALQVMVDSDLTIEASFVQSFNVTVAQSDGGTVVLAPAGGTYEAGETVTLTAVPDRGYEFVNWTGDLSGSELMASLLVDSNKSVVPGFRLILSAFAAWKNEHFTEEERSDASISGAVADADGDKWSNAFEFAAGTDPRVPSDFPGVEARLNPTFEMIVKRPTGITGVEWILEVSPDLGRWNYNGDGSGESYTEDPVVTDAGDGTETIVFRALDVAPQGGVHYFRLRVKLEQ